MLIEDCGVGSRRAGAVNADCGLEVVIGTTWAASWERSMISVGPGVEKKSPDVVKLVSWSGVTVWVACLKVRAEHG